MDQEVLHNILIIESSPTLRYGIKKAVNLPELELIDAPDCHQAIARLSYLSGSTNPPSAVILGWPKQASIFFHELVALLCKPPYESLPLVVIVQDAAILGDVGLDERQNTRLLLWHSLDQISDHLGAMVFPQGVPEPKASEMDNSDINILLVDDSKTIRAQFGSLLRKQGYSVDVSGSPDMAYDMARERHYDLAIIDYYMPEQNGADLCRTLKQDPLTMHMDLSVLTGTYSDDLVTDVLDSGAVECMFKNESSKLFTARVKAMVGMCRQRKQVDHERAQLDNILNSVGEGVYGVDLEGRLTFVNPAARSVFGYDADKEILGNTAHELFHHSDSSSNKVETKHCFLHQAYKLGDKLENWETTFWSKRGTAIPVECTLTPLYKDNELCGSVVAFRDISERLLFEEELKWQINHDHLTQLLNRQYLEQALENEIKRLARTGETSAVLFIDLDRFKQINDLAGHAAGDQLLIEISGKLKERVRESDIIARVSGDEFAVILHNIDPADAEELAEKFREILDVTTFHYADKEFDITGSIGVSIMNKKSLSAERVLANADAACHLAKEKGRNQIHVFDQNRDESSFDEAEKGWIERLSEALEFDQFTLMYQPIYDLKQIGTLDVSKSGRSINNADPVKYDCDLFEVLLRLPDGRGGMVLPRAFLPSAERFGLVWQIDCWVLRKIAALLKDCRDQGQQIKLSVNVSDQSFLNDEFPRMLMGILNHFSISPSCLFLEIKETRAVSNFHKMQIRFNEISKMGVQLVIDEFGRGYTSFSHLQHLSAMHVKINGSFVQSMSSDPIDEAMVTTINDVSHVLERKTVAQHVETAAAFKMLSRMKVDYVQGKFLSEPLEQLPQIH